MESHVDPFLVEALENPRHRLTVLRMELDIQKFLQNSDQLQFEFQHLPTSYLRRVAHRVAQHYGLQTFALDNTVDGSGTICSKIIARKTPESNFTAVCLSEVTAKQTENSITDEVKIAIRQRPSKTSLTDRTELENRKNSVKTVEERKEEYEKARARIFNSPSSMYVEGPSSIAMADGRSFFSDMDELEYNVRTLDENDKARDAASRVAIFRDREKDRCDPDYDRSYNKYVRGLTTSQNLAVPHNVFQPPFLQYGTCSPVGQLLGNQAPVSFRPLSSPMTPVCSFGCNQISTKDGVYHMQWPSPAMMYAQSYAHFRHCIFPAPVYQQSLSFDHSQNF